MDKCILWTGGIDKDGYGKTHGRLAHRVCYEEAFGKIKTGFEIDHICRNRACIRLEHLRVVTHKENMKNSSHSLKTHCKNGHPFDEENTYTYNGTRRICRKCNLEINNRKNRMKKGELT